MRKIIGFMVALAVASSLAAPPAQADGIDRLRRRVHRLENRMFRLRSDIFILNGLVSTLGNAVDEHEVRLDDIEAALCTHEPPLLPC